jgi:hypothetical protein
MTFERRHREAPPTATAAHAPARPRDLARRPVLRKARAPASVPDPAPDTATHALESEADAAAHAMTSGQPFALAFGAVLGAIQCDPPTILDNGRITRELPSIEVAGHRVTLHAGTYVEVTGRSGANLQVRVHSGFRGATATIPADAFHQETEIHNAASATGDAPDQRVMYREFRGALWGPSGPQVADIDQGLIGDCYLLAAMGSIVRANPNRIRSMFSPHTPNLDHYSVTIYHHVRGLGGWTLSPHTSSIDTHFPVLADRQRRASGHLAYAGEGATAAGAPRQPAAPAAPRPAPAAPAAAAAPTGPMLWPLLLERAYAQARGGYQNIDNDQRARRGRGGEDVNDAFEILLGSRGDTDYDRDLERPARSSTVSLPGFPVDERAIADGANPLNLGDAELIALLQRYLTRHIAVELMTRTAPVSPAPAGNQLVDPTDRSLSQLYLNHEYVLERNDAGRIFLFNPHGRGGQLSRGLTPAELRRYCSHITASHAPVTDQR